MMLANSNNKYDVDGIPTDAMAAPLTRMSMQSRRSSDGHSRNFSGSFNMQSPVATRRSEERLIHNYDVENGGERFALGNLDEDSEEDESSGGSGRKRTSFENGKIRAVDFAGKTNGDAERKR